jgi:hypothetical protein
MASLTRWFVAAEIGLWFGRVIAWLMCVLVCASVEAADIEFVQTMHDKIPLYGTQGDDALVVPAGETVEVTGARTELDILVRGTLSVLPGASLSFRTLTAVDGGTIELHEPCTLTVRDMPIDTVLDPSQYGHGILVVNAEIRTVAPSWRQSYCQLGGEARAGDVTLTLASVPTGWQAGDKLVIPDTRQPATSADLSAQTGMATIASIDGATVTLTEPLQYDHLGWRKSDGTPGLLPDVANLTQPIVIRSENPQGVRGHVFVTAASHQDVEGVLLVGMGRTTSAKLHSTARDDQGNLVQIGTNQIGRYAWHHHHLLGRRGSGLPWQFRFEHCSVDGSPKWGIAVHGSHFGIVNDCAVYNAAGCGIVTEDPWVYGNKITNNIVIAKQAGSGERMTSDFGGRAQRNNPAGDFWHNRGGFGFTSAMNEITGNRAYCCTESYGMAGFGTTELFIPKERGVCTCKGRLDPNAQALASQMGYGDDPKRYPFLFDTSGNQAWGGWRGIETWSVHSFKAYPERMFPGLTMVHCRMPFNYFDHQGTYTLNHRSLGDFAQVTTGEPQTFALDFKDDYRFKEKLFENFEARGYDAAYRHVNDSDTTTFLNATVECPNAVYFPVGPTTRIGGDPPRTMRWINTSWVGDVTFSRHRGVVKYGPRLSDNVYRVSQTFVTPWRDGMDYQMFHPLQSSAVDPPVFGEQTPADAESRPDLGFMPGLNVTPCERKVEILQRRIQELEGN